MSGESRSTLHTLDWSADQNDEDKFFAVRRSCRGDSAATMFRKEVQALKAVSGSGHPHLIELLATYPWRGFDHLVFPWAEGNLPDYWKSHPSPTGIQTLGRSSSCAPWFAAQCIGLAEGLEQIHLCLNSQNSARSEEAGAAISYGRHGDLKPQNILWFRQNDGYEGRDTLKISDFGLAEVHGSVVDRAGADTRGGTRTYGAPELKILCGNDSIQDADRARISASGSRRQCWGREVTV